MGRGPSDGTPRHALLATVLHSYRRLFCRTASRSRGGPFTSAGGRAFRGGRSLHLAVMVPSVGILVVRVDAPRELHPDCFSCFHFLQHWKGPAPARRHKEPKELFSENSHSRAAVSKEKHLRKRREYPLASHFKLLDKTSNHRAPRLSITVLIIVDWTRRFEFVRREPPIFAKRKP